MDCQKAQTQLLDFLYDELQAGNTARLEEHLRSCEACAEQLNELKTTRGLLGFGNRKRSLRICTGGWSLWAGCRARKLPVGCTKDFATSSGRPWLLPCSG